MKTRKKFQKHLYASAVLFIMLVSIVMVVDPTQLIPMASFSFSPIIVFFPLFFLLIFCIISYLTLNQRRGLLIALFLTSILILRYLGFYSVFYILILLIITVLVDVFFSR